jgi:predicted transcriptional regulator
MSETKRGRGRPAFEPTDLHREEVERCVACGMTRESIARALGISPPTFDKYFSEQFAAGPARKRQQVIDMLWESAQNGNVSAQKKLLEVISSEQIRAGWQWKIEGAGNAQGSKLGKKEQAQIEAKTAGEGTEWGEDLKFEGGLPN